MWKEGGEKKMALGKRPIKQKYRNIGFQLNHKRGRKKTIDLFSHLNHFF